VQEKLQPVPPAYLVGYSGRPEYATSYITLGVFFMNNDQFELLAAEIAALNRMVIALALASPKLENVIAELDRQQEFEITALLPIPVSDRYIGLVRQRMQALRNAIAAQL
jgi:hypothetical protein